MSWAPDPRIAGASHAVAELALCQARLQDDARWPWLVLLPRRPGLLELADLEADARSRLMDEIVRAGEAVRAVGAATGRPVDKLNVGALGMVVPQLHLHIVGRRRGDDPAGLGPVWGCGVALPYAPDAREAALAAARAALEG